MERFNKFLYNSQQSIKVFLFLIFLINLFRIVFLYIFADKVSPEATLELGACLWLGFRLSLKTAGFIALIGFVLSALPQIVWLKWPAKIIRNVIAYISVFFLTLCLFVRIPYYKIYNSTFNTTLLNALHDDMWAIYDTAVNEYHLYPSLCAVLFITIILCKVLKRFLSHDFFKYEVTTSKSAIRIAAVLAVLIPVFFIIVRFGGGYSYGTGIHWENAARLKYHILNEAILDDGQALYRVWSAKRRLDKSVKIGINKEELKKSIMLLGGNPEAATIDKAMERTVESAMLAERPQQVVFILGENYATWPLLDEYKDLNLVNESKKIINSGKAAYTLNFLAQGAETVVATNALLTGLNNLMLHENYQPISYKEKYNTGIGNILKNLGYKTYFWYGGFAGWQDIEKFALAQGFDYFYSADDFPYSEGNTWGAADEYLYKAITKHMESNKDEKAFHFVLTMSNHPTFSLDVESKGFDKNKIKAVAPKSIPTDEETLKQLGHIWYADKMMGNFINAVETMHPNTLFTIVGDHAARFSFNKEATLQEAVAVPCIIYGKDVKPNWFIKNQTGSQMQIPGTLAQILGRPGEKYSAIMPNLFNNKDNIGVNNGLCCDGVTIRAIDENVKELFKAVNDVSAWRVTKGNVIE